LKSIKEWLLRRLKALNDQLNEQNQAPLHCRLNTNWSIIELLTYHKIWQIKLLYTYPVGNLSLSALSLLTGAWFCSFNWSLSALSLLSNHSFIDFNSKWFNFLSISSLNTLHCWFQASSWKIGMICEIMTSLTF
jgi:hypothetical protein